MITGFNTDIEHDGVVYHVQTEDKGLDTPIILSLVYAGGTILASKRSPYADLIEQGFSDEILAERLKRQHRLICAAIHSGRIDDLKKMSRGGRETVVQEAGVSAEEEPSVMESAPVAEEFEIELGPFTPQWTPPPPVEEVETTDEHGLEHGTVQEETASQLEEPAPEEPVEELLPEGLLITMLDDEEFYSGEKYTLRVLITN
ncbi:MAG TPA: hypothetical protein VFO72_04485, partial [Pyrinomonadaceae bacterium]|nr:hypothetical protein [Pyrinomonadaceae bacterium]